MLLTSGKVMKKLKVLLFKRLYKCSNYFHSTFTTGILVFSHGVTKFLTKLKLKRVLVYVYSKYKLKAT